MPELKCTLSTGLWALLQGRSESTREPLGLIVSKALAAQGPVIVGVPVDYRENHQFREILHPNALN
jgi:hypothetical protein